MNAPRTIRLSPEDNVVVAVDQIAAGAAAAGVTARERVPRGHKMAVAAISEGEPVRKYGQTIVCVKANRSRRLGARAKRRTA
jgi:altronate hydrolase